MEKLDIREYGDSELSMHVYNDEGLYKMRHKKDLMDIIDELFIYTEAQRSELLQDLEGELEEEEEEEMSDEEIEEELEWFEGEPEPDEDSFQGKSWRDVTKGVK